MRKVSLVKILGFAVVLGLAGCTFNNVSPVTEPADEQISEIEETEVTDTEEVDKTDVEEEEPEIEEVEIEEVKPEPVLLTLGEFETMSDEHFVDISGIDCSELDIEGFLDSFTELEKITMKDCGLTNDEYAALQDVHPEFRIIWDIKTRWWTIPTDSVGFSTLIGKNDGRRLYNDDVKYFKYCTDMVALDIGHCCVSDLSFLEYMPNLKVLIIVENYPSDGSSRRLKDISALKYCTKLRYLEFFANDVEDISALQYLTELEDLNFCYNPVTSAEYIKDLPNLQKLWIYGTRIPAEELKELRELHPDCKIVTSGSGSVDQGWRSGDHYNAMRNMVKNNVIDPVYAEEGDILPEEEDVSDEANDSAESENSSQDTDQEDKPAENTDENSVD
ncbi:MAG: hypothetical protein K6G75_04375 [Lachnospiraceae bacterium]|nr:hypothetical protein [Lachnospiraceae bacterium]